MKTTLSLIVGLPAILLSSTLLAQTTTTTTTTPGSPARTTPATSSYESVPTSSYDAGYGAKKGDHEFTIAGSGVSNDDLDDSAGGLSASYGVYFTDALSLSLRQSVDYINPDAGDDGWAGTTGVALDVHLGEARVRPLVGVSAGYIYGDEIDESFYAGLEAGLKFYVQSRTFIFALAEYVWSFEDTDDADDTFEDGGFRWTAGVGFNF